MAVPIATPRCLSFIYILWTILCWLQSKKGHLPTTFFTATSPLSSVLRLWLRPLDTWSEGSHLFRLWVFFSYGNFLRGSSFQNSTQDLFKNYNKPHQTNYREHFIGWVIEFWEGKEIMYRQYTRIKANKRKTLIVLQSDSHDFYCIEKYLIGLEKNYLTS